MVTSSAPIGIEGVSGNGVRSHAARAVALIRARPTLGLPLPSAIESLTGMTLIERVIACVYVTAPEKPPEKLCGHQLPMHTGESITTEVGLKPCISAVA